MDKYALAERCAKTSYLIEATPYEEFALWQAFSLEHARDGRGRTEFDAPRVSWRNLDILGYPIGTLDDRPVMLLLHWAIVGDRLLCFFHASSQVVDHAMIDAHLSEKFPGVPRCDPMNFGRALAHVRDLKHPPLKLEESGRILGREAVDNFRKERILTTRMVEDSGVAVDRGEDGAVEISAAVQRLSDCCASFRDQVWGAWLKESFAALPQAGASSTTEGVSMLVFTSAGRVMVTLRRPGTDVPYVSLLGYTGTSSGMYLRGCTGDHVELCRLIEDAIAAGEGLKAALVADNVVRLSV